MSTLQAVLWDMDGTLVDTEVLWDKAIYSTMEKVGAPLTPQQRVQTIGMSMENLLRALAGFAGGASDELIQTINDSIVEKMGELYRTKMKWQPGAMELVNELRASDIPQALVTNTQRVLTNLAMDKLGKKNFAVSVCGDEVVEGKPAAHPYRCAAELLNVDPTCCLVVEDSMTGVTSGVAAGCRVLGVRSENPLEEGEKYEIWDSLSGITVADLKRYMGA